MDENKQAEPVGEIQIEDMGQPFNAMRVRVHFYKEVPQVGAKIYTKAPAATINKQLYTALEGLLAITRDSQGVAGYHLNGVVAKWDEFEEVSAAEAAITAAEAEAANHIEPTLEKVSAVAVNEQDRLDAARYRYLRDNGDGFDMSVREEGDEGEEWVHGYPPEELDSAIDAAIAAAEAAKGGV